MGLFTRRKKEPDPVDESARTAPAAASPVPAGDDATPSDGAPGSAGAVENVVELMRVAQEMLGQGDIDAAQTAFKRAEAAGSVQATLKLAALMEDHHKDLAAAEAAWRRADEAGDINGSGNLGRLLREQGDMRGAEAAFLRCYERGSLRAAADYAELLSQRDDATAAEISDAVVALCQAIDAYLVHDDGMLMAAPFVLEGVQERCDPQAVEAGLRRADEHNSSASGAFHHALLLRDRGEYAAATAGFHRSAQRGYGDGWVQAANGYLELGDTATAEATAREGEKADIAAASTMLGMILDQQGDTDGGLESYRRADAAGHGVGSFNLGIELKNRGELEAAEQALARAEERGADNAADARRALRRELGLDSADVSLRHDGESLWAWGERLEMAGDRGGAVRAFFEAMQAGDEPQTPLAMLRHAEFLEARDEPGAEAAFLKLADVREPQMRASAWRGIASYRLARGATIEGLAALQVVVETGVAVEATRAWRNIGAIHDELGDSEAARSAYRSAIAVNDPEHSPGARVNLAQLLSAEGDHTGAARLFREAIESGHAKEAPRARVLLGLMLEEQGDVAGALQWWESAITSEDEEWSQRAAFNAGAEFFQREDFAGAAQLLRIGSRMASPGEAATAFYFLGLCEARLGDGPAAAAALRRAAELGSGEVRAEALRLLRSVR